MKEQKNIDRLFQEKFKDFEMAPPEMAWKNIETRLKEKKKKRRVIPFWFKTTGIAASLLLGFYTFMYYNSNDRIESNEKTVETNNGVNDKKINEKNTNPIINENSLIISDESIVNDNNNFDKQPNDNLTSKNDSKALESNENNKSLNGNNQNNLVKNKKTFQNKSIKNKIEPNKLFDIEKEEIFVTNKETQNEKSNLPFQNLNEKENKRLIQEKKNSNRSVAILEKSNVNITQDSSILANISEEVSALEQLLKEKEVGKNAEEKRKNNQCYFAIQWSIEY